MEEYREDDPSELLEGPKIGFKIPEVLTVEEIDNIIGADICEYRMLSKGNVSQGIEALIQKGYLMRAPDTKDRRKIHLHLTPKADEIVLQIDEIKDAFHKKITDGISPSDLALYQQASDKIFNNICKELERKESSHES